MLLPGWLTLGFAGRPCWLLTPCLLPIQVQANISALGSMRLFVRRFPVEIRNQCIEAIMFIVMKQTLVSITIWCQIKIKIRKLRATKEIKCGIWDILGNIPHFKVNTTDILVPFLLPLPLLLYLLTVLFLNWSTVQIDSRHFKTRWTWSLSCLVGWSIVGNQRDWALNGLIKLTLRDVLLPTAPAPLHWQDPW